MSEKRLLDHSHDEQPPRPAPQANRNARPTHQIRKGEGATKLLLAPGISTAPTTLPSFGHNSYLESGFVNSNPYHPLVDIRFVDSRVPVPESLRSHGTSSKYDSGDGTRSQNFYVALFPERYLFRTFTNLTEWVRYSPKPRSTESPSVYYPTSADGYYFYRSGLDFGLCSTTPPSPGQFFVVIPSQALNRFTRDQPDDHLEYTSRCFTGFLLLTWEKTLLSLLLVNSFF